MEEDKEERLLELPKKINIRQIKSKDTHKMSIQIPPFLNDIIAEEAAAKGKSKAAVITYLIYCGLKAHIGQFRPPNENTIMINYYKRGKNWKIHK